MRISDNEVKRVLSGESVARAIVHGVGETDATTLHDPELVRKLAAEVLEMEDRDEMIADLRARIQAGTYNPTGDDIADTMVRRAIADRIR